MSVFVSRFRVLLACVSAAVVGLFFVVAVVARDGGGREVVLSVSSPSLVGDPNGVVARSGAGVSVLSDRPYLSSGPTAPLRVLPDRVAGETTAPAASSPAPGVAVDVAVPAASSSAVTPAVPVPVTTVAPVEPPVPVVVPVDPCSLESVQAVVAGMLAPFAIPVPVVALGSTSFYQPGVGVTFEPCADRSTVAHELGHYVIDRANGSFSAHVSDVTANFCPGGAGPDGRCVAGWIRGNEIYPGIEHAAHCVGHVLIGYTVYTKCPDPALLALARERVRQAS